MTNADLPETKLAPPAPPNDLVVRPRLHAALSAGVAGRLTLVSAPPGAGKTVMVAAWVADGAAPGPVAWASLDPGDADRHRFWRLVAAALGLDVAVPRRGDLSATLDGLCHALSSARSPWSSCSTTSTRSTAARCPPTSIGCWRRRRRRCGSSS